MTDLGSLSKTDATSAPSRGTILFADDEPLLRELAAAALERAGFHVVVAASADEAAAALEAGQAIDLAVLDWTMPGASGALLVERARAACPRLRIVISSGAVDEDVRALKHRDATVHILEKPWRARALLALVASLLE